MLTEACDNEAIAGLFERHAMFLTPSPRLSPTEWSRANRRYPASAGRPGARDPAHTPYIIPITAAIETGHREIVMVCGSQMGKTDGVLDLIGWRLDTRPRPQLYIGPTREFVCDQVEPRIMALLDEAPTLRDKVARGKRNKRTRKLIGGVSLRLAWAGPLRRPRSEGCGRRCCRRSARGFAG